MKSDGKDCRVTGPMGRYVPLAAACAICAAMLSAAEGEVGPEVRAEWEKPDAPAITATEAMALPIPEFARARIASAQERYRRWKGADTAVAIPFITDVHDWRGYFPASNTWASSKMHIRLLRAAAEAFDADLIGDLGDKGIDCKGHWKIPGNEAHLRTRTACEQALYGDYSFSAMFSIPGNHDHGSVYAPISNADFGRLFNSFPANDRPGMEWGPNRDYGKFDVPGKSCRVIFLNTTESPKGNGYGMNSAQVAFAQREMETVPAGWSLLVFTHKCLHPSCGRWDYPNWKPQDFKGFAEIRDAMKAAAARKDIHFIGCICGDSHFDIDYTEDGVRYLISQGYAGCGKKLHPKDQPSATELAFDRGKDMLIDVACVKPETGDFRLFRIGVGDASRDR